jgi:uncharacterized protein YjbI with pentapeptide repeats
LIHRGFISAVIVSGIVEEQGEQVAGEKEARKPWTLRELWGKPVWDWLDLLLVPLVLGIVAAGLTAWFNAQQNTRQNHIEKERAQAEQKLAEQRAEDEALQAYLNQMGTLLLEKDLRDSDKNSEVRTLARARTLTVLTRLDGDHKASVLQFLYESGLIRKNDPVIPLIKADLRHVDLYLTNMNSVSLAIADLQDANMQRANLYGTILVWAHLEGADLRDAALTNADLSQAHLKGADLHGAYLDDADLEGARGWNVEQLSEAKLLDGATMPDGQTLKSRNPLPWDPKRPTFEEWRKDRGS